MSGRGRPLRFLALVLTGWIAIRTLMLWPEAESLPDALRKAVPLASLLPDTASQLADGGFAEPRPLRVPGLRPRTRIAPRSLAFAAARSIAPAASRRVTDPVRVQFAVLGFLQYGDPIPVDLPAPIVPPARETRIAPPPVPDRWSGGAWLVVRGGTGIGAAPGAGQIGGSQAGARAAFAPRGEIPVALFGRATAPLRSPGREAAIGVEYRPGKAPVKIVAEQRFALDGGTSGPGLGAVTWLDTHLPRGFRLEGYGQAGAVLRDRIEPYADGALRTSRALSDGDTPLSLGAGAWGAAQRDASRLDIGPSATVTLPVAGRPVRASVDWRERVAGDARPGSGLVFTLGADF